MTRNIVRAGIGMAGLLVSLVVACQSTTDVSGPGALPSRRVDQNPKVNAATFIAHGNLLERQGHYERAIEQYRKALELTPSSVLARNRLGVTLNKVGRHAEATQEFRRAVALGAKQAALHNNLGFSLYLEKDWAAARKAIRRALELDPNFRRARMNSGLIFAKQGRYDAALAEFQLAGTPEEAYYNLAVVQADAGEYRAAARSLSRAREINPDWEDARELLVQIAYLAAEQEEQDRVIAARQMPPEALVDNPALTKSAGHEPKSVTVARATTPEPEPKPEPVQEAPPAPTPHEDIQVAASIEPAPNPQPEQVQADADDVLRMLAEINGLIREITTPDYGAKLRETAFYEAFHRWIDSWTKVPAAYESAQRQFEHLVGCSIQYW